MIQKKINISLANTRLYIVDIECLPVNSKMKGEFVSRFNDKAVRMNLRTWLSRVQLKWSVRFIKHAFFGIN